LHQVEGNPLPLQEQGGIAGENSQDRSACGLGTVGEFRRESQLIVKGPEDALSNLQAADDHLLLGLEKSRNPARSKLKGLGGYISGMDILIKRIPDYPVYLMHLKVLLNSFRELYSTGCKVSQSLTKVADNIGIKIDAL